MRQDLRRLLHRPHLISAQLGPREPNLLDKAGPYPAGCLVRVPWRKGWFIKSCCDGLLGSVGNEIDSNLHMVLQSPNIQNFVKARSARGDELQTSWSLPVNASALAVSGGCVPPRLRVQQNLRVLQSVRRNKNNQQSIF